LALVGSAEIPPVTSVDSDMPRGNACGRSGHRSNPGTAQRPANKARRLPAAPRSFFLQQGVHRPRGLKRRARRSSMPAPRIPALTVPVERWTHSLRRSCEPASRRARRRARGLVTFDDLEHVDDVGRGRQDREPESRRRRCSTRAASGRCAVRRQKRVAQRAPAQRTPTDTWSARRDAAKSRDR